MPWVGQPADPAAHYGQGFQIGMRLGAEQAANQYRQQRLMAEQQRSAFEAALENQKMNLSIAETIRKHQAQSQFADLMRGGASAEQALMQAGPAMGESINETLRTQAMLRNQGFGQRLNMMRFQQMMQNQAVQQELARQRIGVSQEVAQTGKAREQLAEKTAAERSEDADTREKRLAARAQSLAVQAMEKNDPEYQKAQSQIKLARAAVRDIENQRWWSEKNRQSAMRKAQENLKAEVDDYNRKMREIYAKNGLDPNLAPVETVAGPAPTPAPDGTNAPPAADTGDTNQVREIGGFRVRPIP